MLLSSPGNPLSCRLLGLSGYCSSSCLKIAWVWMPTGRFLILTSFSLAFLHALRNMLNPCCILLALMCAPNFVPARAPTWQTFASSTHGSWAALTKPCLVICMRGFSSSMPWAAFRKKNFYLQPTCQPCLPPLRPPPWHPTPQVLALPCPCCCQI